MYHTKGAITPSISFKSSERSTLAPSQSLYYKPTNQSINSVLNEKQTFRYSLDSSTFFDSDSIVHHNQLYSTNEHDDSQKKEKGSRRSSAASSFCSIIHSTKTKPVDKENSTESTLTYNREECDLLNKEVQERLWNEDTAFCPVDKISEWLGTNEPFRAQVLCLYMQNFDFTHQRLDEAFRTLCSKLYLKAESQQLDRVIEAFAKRFYECNPTTLLHSVDVIHAVSYSLLLLNTDLHIVSDKGNKMTKSNFVKNTMETVQVLMFPDVLSQRKRVASFSSSDSCAIRRRSISLSTPSFGSQSFKNTWDDQDLHSSHGGNNILLQKLDLIKSNISWKSSATNQPNSFHDGLTRTQKTWIVDTEALLKDMYSSVKSHRIDQADIINADNESLNYVHRSRTLPKSEQRKETRRRRGHSVVAENILAVSTLSSLPSHRRLTEPSPIFDPIAFKEYRQGIVMRKHVMETSEKKAKHRQWQLCYLVMNETEMIMYKAVQKNDVRGKKRKSMIFWNQSVVSPFSLQDIVSSDADEWQPDLNQPALGMIPLNHCYATSVLPPGWNGQRPHVFRLESAEGGLWMFESTDMFAIQAWVEAVNFSAATISKNPMQGAVCNIDYGWGADWENDESSSSLSIPIWYPPTPCMIQSILSLEEQYDYLKSQIKETTEQLDKHRTLKSKSDKKCSSQAGNCIQILVNWDKKFHHISHELIKLRCYRDILKPRIIT
ncbi:hypothetical protein G6F56_008065 [Rhizopus delemar]|nr:hypothetical protein G6F56_008065 [Rhizopus delemar]